MIKPTLLLVAAMVASVSVTPVCAAPTVTRYACSASQQLSVQRTGLTARVSLGGQSYNLRRQRSSMGTKYLSSRAALIIDGPAAVFVADDHLDLGTCVRAIPVALAR